MPIDVVANLRQKRLAALRDALAPLPLAGRRLTLEVGCGHGHFLTAYAAAHRDEFCLAIDVLADRLERAARKSQRAGLTNIAWLQADALDLLAAWPTGAQVTDHLFVLFPDPWPKRRHWKHRLLQPAFLTAAAACCAPGARLCFRTDHAPYFTAAQEAVAIHPDWQLEDGPPWPFEEPTVFQARADAYQSLVAIRAGRAAPAQAHEARARALAGSRLSPE